MAISYLRVLNSRGLVVYTQKFDTKNSFFDDESNDLESIISSIYFDLQANYPKKLGLKLVEGFKTIPTGLFLYFFIDNFDLFILFTDSPLTESIDLTAPLIKEVIHQRAIDRSFFKGIVIADFDDTQGPLPIFNSSTIDDDFLAVLAVQGTTVLGMGMTTMPDHIVGPVPIPQTPELSTLIRGFQRQAPHSNDPRIQLGGRPTTIFIVIDSRTMLNKETLDFIDSFLTQWIFSDAVKEFLDRSDLVQMATDLEQLIILSQDLVRIRDFQTMHLRELLKIYTSENAILKQENLHLRNQLAQKNNSPVSPKKTTKKTAKKAV